MLGTETWLPQGKRAGVVFSIDDVHPGTSRDPYEAGGDLERGALGHVQKLLESHQQAYVTLFVTADWREISPAPTRTTLARVPWLRDHVYLAEVHPKGTMRVDRHPGFASYLAGLPRTEVALHGLHHVHPGPRVATEFQRQSRAQCAGILREAQEIFAAAGVGDPQGMTPPSWNAPPALLDAMQDVGLHYVASACDIATPVDLAATNTGSGLRDVPVFLPTMLRGRGLVHVPSNYRATSTWDRAAAILEAGGLLSVKGHIIKDALGFVALDGLDEEYAEHLDGLFARIVSEFGESVWWATMGDVAKRVQQAAGVRV